MINLRAEIENTRGQILAEHKRIIGALANEVRVAEAAVASIRDQLQTIDLERAATNEDRVQFLQMKREALSNRKLYELFVARAKDAEEHSSLITDPVEMIASAKAPTHPSAPKKPLIIAFGFFISIGFGLALVLVIERLDGGFRSVTQVERVIREPVLGIVPRIRGSKHRRNHVHDIVFNDAHSAYVESIRSLRTSLLVASADAPPKVVLIASSQSGDGKTSLAISLARLSATASIEGRVLLIDGDLRKPSVAPRIGANPTKGLIHLFSGEASLDEVIVTDEKSGLHVLPATIGTPNPPELLNSTHMRDLLAKLRSSYEMIIIDSPALAAVSDARVLAHYADTTVFVLRWEGTKQHAAVEAVKQLTSAGARISGVVLQQVNIKKTESYGYREAVA
jgi:polysaccharide biosynthesis transport protein